MNTYRRHTLGLGIIILLCTTAMLWAQSATRPADDMQTSTAPADATRPAVGDKIGYVTGNNVYVRSGFHQNYYPVTKLNRGDKVEVLGEEFGWLKIAAPVGTYSLVEKGYVDTTDATNGTTNDTAWVRAGSNLNDRRYAKQVQLPAGTRVKIIGETSDGAYYKIEPPPGAALWIKGDFVDRTGRLPTDATSGRRSAAALETVPPGQLSADSSRPRSGALMATRPADATTPPSEPAPTGATPEQLSQYQMEINAIEAQIAAEGTKPFDARNYEPMIGKLQALADNAQDETTQIYARTRIEQIQGQSEVIAAVRELEQMKEKAVDEADRLAAMRARIKAQEAAPMDDTVVRGEIRVSGLYDGTAGRPRRWRIVGLEGTPQANRTLAYLEIAPGSTIDPVQYYGKYVGVRASGRQMLEGTIPPVPIYTIQEITILNPDQPKKGMTRREAVASPQPATAKPATRPAAKWTPVPPEREGTAQPPTTQPQGAS